MDNFYCHIQCVPVHFQKNQLNNLFYSILFVNHFHVIFLNDLQMICEQNFMGQFYFVQNNIFSFF